MWVPEHCGIDENKVADNVARDAAIELRQGPQPDLELKNMN